MTAPNIVFILADDLGWADLGVYGATDFKTPHLDRLAAQGVRFNQAYANSAVCSATRIALITGRYQYRLRAGLEEPLARYGGQLGLPPDHPTLPSLLKKAGYDTALIGKWHLGQPPAYGPQRSGYDYFFGNHHGAIDYFTHKPGVGEQFGRDLWQGSEPVERSGYYTYILGDEATRYVQERKNIAKPFFLSLHFTAPHWPWEGPDDEHVAHSIKNLFHYDGGSLKKYGEIVEALDKAVGQVLQALDDSGQADNTIVIFTSDNGGERFSKTWPFTGQKTELLEGGIATFDWLPTLLTAAGAQQDPNYPSDGQNILPVLEGDVPSEERTLFWRYKSQAQRAVRQGPWKYLKINDNEFLFNVEDDARERANLKDHQPEIFTSLRRQWEEWNEQLLPITAESYSHGLSPDIQADRYVPASLKQG